MSVGFVMDFPFLYGFMNGGNREDMAKISPLFPAGGTMPASW
jgi:hypothetical protein